MGTFFYGPTGASIEIENRVLAHVQVVMVTKLRWGESFAFTWERSADLGSGRTTIWVTPRSHIEFSFTGSTTGPINRVWVEALMRHANSPAGLELISEQLAMTSPHHEPQPTR